MSARVHCNHEFTCPAFLFANEVWSIVKREQEKAEAATGGQHAHSFAVSTIIHTKKESRGKSSRHSRTPDDLLDAMNKALAHNGNTTSYVESASKFMQFDQFCMSISSGVDKLAVEKVSRSRESPIAVNGASPNLDFFSSVFQCRSETVRHHWDRISSLLACIDTHTRNAAEYHSFFTDCSELSNCMTTHGVHLLRVFSKERVQPPFQQGDIDVIAKTMVDMATAFKFYEQRLSELRNRAYSTVCPIQYRTKPLLQDCRLPARCLVDADVDVVTLRKRQDLFILENTDPTAWKVRTIEGDVIEIPSIFVEIPAPCEEAVECYGKLVAQMVDLWSDVVKAAANYLIWVTFVVFTNVGDNEKTSMSANPQVAKSKLLQLVLLMRNAFGETWKHFDGVDKVDRLVTELANQIPPTASELTGEKSPILSQVDRLTSAINSFDKFTTDWKRFAVGGQVCRAPEAFLVADHVDFVAAAKLDFTAIPTEQDELVKQKWRQKVEAQRKHWKDEDAKPKLVETAQIETQTLQVETKSEEVEAEIMKESADANVDCVAVLDASESQTDPEPVIERNQNETQTEVPALVNQEAATVTPATTDQTIDCTTTTTNAEIQTDAVAGRRLSRSDTLPELTETETTSERVEAMHVASVNTEEEQQFVITGVVDMVTDTIISVDDATKRNILDQAAGTYRNTENNELMPIPEAMNLGLIIMEIQFVSRKEHKTSYGVITVIEHTEKKSCKILSVTNAKTGEKVFPKEAISLGLLDPAKTWVLDTRNGKQVPLNDAMKLKLVEVLQRTSAGAAKQPLRKQYEVHEVVDRKSGKTLTYDEAIKSNLLNPENGEFFDTISDKKLPFSEAIKLNFITAKLLETS